MSPFQTNIIEAENGQKFLTAFVGGKLMPPISSDHPNWSRIMELIQGDEIVDEAEFAELFDIPTAIENRFERLTDKVTVENGQVKFDGDPAQPVLSRQILRFMEEGEDFMPLVHFMEKIQLNPSEHSREQAFEWLNNHDITITEEGDVIGYKGMDMVEAYGENELYYLSINSGTATVNDEVRTGRIRQVPGDIVRMPRSAVIDDPYTHCSYGLHVGTFNYAQGYGTIVARVIVNPRNIVSVPNDAGGQKIRVCEYEFVEVIEQEDTSALYRVEVQFGPTDEELFEQAKAEIAPKFSWLTFDQWQNSSAECTCPICKAMNNLIQERDSAADEAQRFIDDTAAQEEKIEDEGYDEDELSEDILSRPGDTSSVYFDGLSDGFTYDS